VSPLSERACRANTGFVRHVRQVGWAALWTPPTSRITVRLVLCEPLPTWSSSHDALYPQAPLRPFHPFSESSPSLLDIYYESPKYAEDHTVLPKPPRVWPYFSRATPISPLNQLLRVSGLQNSAQPLRRLEIESRRTSVS